MVAIVDGSIAATVLSSTLIIFILAPNLLLLVQLRNVKDLGRQCNFFQQRKKQKRNYRTLAQKHCFSPRSMLEFQQFLFRKIHGVLNYVVAERLLNSVIHIKTLAPVFTHG